MEVGIVRGHRTLNIWTVEYGYSPFLVEEGISNDLPAR
jgi:hypothetical protein